MWGQTSFFHRFQVSAFKLGQEKKYETESRKAQYINCKAFDILK